MHNNSQMYRKLDKLEILSEHNARVAVEEIDIWLIRVFTENYIKRPAFSSWSYNQQPVSLA